MPFEASEPSVGITEYRITTTSAETGWLDAEAHLAAIQLQNQVFRNWTNSTSCVTCSTTGEWPTGWIEVDEGTSSATNTITLSTGNTVAANAIWGLDNWQQCEHSETRWTPTISKRVPKTAEELVHEAAEREKRRQHRIRQNARRDRFKKAANCRARGLLMQLLTQDQRKELDDKNRFHLTVHSRDGSMRVYRIDYGYAGNVKLLGADGRPDRSYCIHSDSRLPFEDQMLAQKLMLESDEKKFLRIANETIIRRIAA